MSDIFSERQNIKPYEYPKMLDFVNAIDDSFWTVRKFRFDKDILEYQFDLSEVEQEFIKRSMLSIAQVENQVKKYFGRIDERLPKPEIAFVGAKFSANEVTHSLAYSQFLEDAKLNDEFRGLVEVPAMQDRIAYLKKYTQGLNSRSNKEFIKSHILFTMLTENISLYMPFLNMSAVKKYRQKMKTVGKVIMATAREEQLHTLFGLEIIKIVRAENPDWFDEEMEDKIRRNIRKAIKAEERVADWIFEKGEPNYISKAEAIEYLKYRANNSLELLGYTPEYKLDEALKSKSDYMDIMLKSKATGDFFDEELTDYNKNIDFRNDTLLVKLQESYAV